MSESIKQLIECEARARKRLEEALRTQEDIKKQALVDSDNYMKEFIRTKERELDELEQENDAWLANLGKELEREYKEFLEKMDSRSIEAPVNKVVEFVALK